MNDSDGAMHLAEYAASHDVDLTPYREARDNLEVSLGNEFPRVGSVFDREVLLRLRFNGNDIVRAVGHARVALLDIV